MIAATARALVALAGPVASHRLVGGYCRDVVELGGEMDVQHAEQLLAQPDMPPFAQMVRRVTELVGQEWPRIEAIADALVRHRRLDYATVCEIVGR